MDSLGPFLGMALLGLVAGWMVGRLCHKAIRIAVLAAVVFIALQLIGFQVASLHGETLIAAARSAADRTTGAVESPGGVAWRLVTYNLPFTIGFALGLYKALPIPRRRR